MALRTILIYFNTAAKDTEEKSKNKELIIRL